VHEDSTTGVKAILDKLVGGREVFEQVFIVHIVHFDHHVLETLEQLLVERKPQHRQDVGDAASLESFPAA